MDEMNEITPEAEKKHGHYYKNVEKYREIDVYRVLRLFNITDPALAHAAKKLLVAGGRGAGKSQEQDIREVIDSCSRFLSMNIEDDAMPRKYDAQDMRREHDNGFVLGEEEGRSAKIAEMSIAELISELNKAGIHANLRVMEETSASVVRKKATKVRAMPDHVKKSLARRRKNA